MDDPKELCHLLGVCLDTARQSARIFRQVHNELEEMTEKLEALASEMDLSEEISESRAMLSDLRRHAEHAHRASAKHEFELRDDIGLRWPDKLEKTCWTWLPRTLSLAEALLALMRCGASVVVECRAESPAAVFEVRSALFILRTLGWEIQRYEWESERKFVYALGHDHLPLIALSHGFPILFLEERKA